MALILCPLGTCRGICVHVQDSFARFAPDMAHGGLPDHMDVIQPLRPEIKGVEKLRIDGLGNILTDELLISPKDK